MYSFLQRHRAAIFTGTLALLVAGGFAIPRLGSGIYPEVEFPRISVVVRGGDEPPQVLQATAVRPVEEALAGVLGVHRIRTRIIRGAAEVALFFSPGTDMALALQFVDSRLAEVRPDLPDGIELESERLTPAEFPIVAYNLVGGEDARTRREAAERMVRPALERAPGIARITILGGDEREVEVIVDPGRLASLHLRPTQLGDRLAAQLVRRGVGRFDSARQTSAVLFESPPAQGRVVDAIGGLPATDAALGPLPLRSLAAVEDGAADRRVIVQAPEGDAVQIAVSRLPDASTPDVAAALAEEAAKLHLPAGMHLVKVYDQGELVREAIGGIRDAILLGILLTTLVLAFFLRDTRSGLLAALSLPATLLATFAVMSWTGQTLNLMSLGGLAIAIGLVIDDAVVVVEAIVAQREAGHRAAGAIAAALRDVAAPVVGTTLTTVVVFVPLAFLEGIVGRFFAALAITLSAAVLISLLFALVVLPVLGARVLRHQDGHARLRGGRRRSPRHPLRARYAWALRRLLRHRRWVLAGAVVAVGAGLFALRQVPSGFLPEFDEGTFVLDYFLPAGTSLAETDRVARQIERVLTADPAVETWSRRTGAELGPITATQFNRGDITVRLKPRRDREAGEAIIDRLRARLASAAPAARLEFIQLIEDVLSDLSGAPRPIEVRISGDNPAELERAARDLQHAAAQVPGLVDYYAGVEGRVPTLRVVPDPVALARLGLGPADLADDLSAALKGRVVGHVPYLDRLIGVRLRYPDAARFDGQAIRRLPVLSSDGNTVALAEVARITEDPEPSVLFREDLHPVAIATAAVEGADLGAAGRAIEAKIKTLEPPAGGAFELGGGVESQRQAFTDLLGVFLLGLLAVIAVLVGQFRAIGPALLVLATLPPALAGAFLLLALTGTPLNASSLIGLVLLTGLVVKNGILLMERVQRNRDSGLPRGVALVEAARGRVRPILMTTLCTIFGLLPLALGLGVAGEMQRPLALAVVGGLAVSTAATLFVLPALAVGARFRLRAPEHEPVPQHPG